MPIALPYHICRLGEPCDKPCRFAAMYNNASFRVCRHARFCRPSDIREPRSRLPLGSSPSPSTPQKSSRHAAGLLNGTGMEGFGRSGHSPLGGEWLKLVETGTAGSGATVFLGRLDIGHGCYRLFTPSRLTVGTGPLPRTAPTGPKWTHKYAHGHKTALNQRVLGSSPSASTKFYNKFKWMSKRPTHMAASRFQLGSFLGSSSRKEPLGELIVFKAELWPAGHESERSAPLRGSAPGWVANQPALSRFGSSLAIREKSQGVEHDKQRRAFVHGNSRPDAETEDRRRNQKRNHTQTDEDILTDDRTGLAA